MSSKSARVRVRPWALGKQSDNQRVIRLHLPSNDKVTDKVTDSKGSIVSSYVPRMVIPKPSSKDQRVYIKFKVWNSDVGRFVWAKDFEVDGISPGERKKFLPQKVKEIQSLLFRGYQKGKSNFKAEEEIELIKDQKKTLTIFRAIEIGVEEKKGMKLRKFIHYEMHSRIFFRWLKAVGYANLPVDMFRMDHIKQFLHYLRNTRKCSPRTLNNYISILSACINICIENELVETNHFKKIKKEQTGLGRNWAYTVDQQSEILNFVKKEFPHFLLMIQFMYYTLARPVDLANMKIEDIGKRYPDQIHFPEHITKEMMERNIVIPNQLQILIDEAGLKNYPPNWYVFGENFLPTPKKYISKNWGTRYRQCILDKFGDKYKFNYTLYSWKHTGVVTLWNSGVPANLIQRQTGHRHQYSFEKYLKSLGLFDNQIIKNNFPGLPV